MPIPPGHWKMDFKCPFLSPVNPLGIPEQHFATCKRFQGIPSLCGWKDTETFQSSGNLACQHRKGAKEGDRAD
jgi:hypothetical protein